jgi:hypothetical protein
VLPSLLKKFLSYLDSLLKLTVKKKLRFLPLLHPTLLIQLFQFPPEILLLLLQTLSHFPQSLLILLGLTTKKDASDENVDRIQSSHRRGPNQKNAHCGESADLERVKA